MTGEHGEPVTVSGAYVLDRHHHIRASCTTEEDAVRIAACLNALNGVTTADIKAGCVAELVEALDSADKLLGNIKQYGAMAHESDWQKCVPVWQEIKSARAAMKGV